MYRDDILVAHWPPLTQVFTHYAYLITGSVFGVRIAFAVVTSFLGIAFFDFLTLFQDRKPAFYNALFLTLNPLIIFLSIVPYQEVLLLIFTFYTLVYLYTSNYVLSAICFGLACLTRFEAWFLAPFILYWLYDTRRRGQSLLNLFGVASLYSLGFIAWFLINYFAYGHPLHFLKSYGNTDHLEYPNTYLKSVGEVLFWTVKYGGPMVIVGLVAMVRRPKEVIGHSRMLLLFFWYTLLLLFLIPAITEGYIVNQRVSIYNIVLISVYVYSGIELIKQRLSILPVLSIAYIVYVQTF